MTNRISLALIGLLIFSVCQTASGTTTTYTWHQTSTSVPGVQFYGSYTLIDGYSVSADGYDPIDLTGLVSLDIYGHNVPDVTLADLTPTCVDYTYQTCYPGFPGWSIDVSGSSLYLFFVNADDTYDWNVDSNGISADTDNDAAYPCDLTGVCHTTGYWSVPEPLTLSLFGAGLLMLGVRRKRQRT